MKQRIKSYLEGKEAKNTLPEQGKKSKTNEDDKSRIPTFSS